jgi:5'-AMP-activated protein kinase regulatory beta subunit
VKKAKPKGQIKKRRVDFSLNAPQAQEVLLVGDFNQWNPKTHPMKKDQDGNWMKTVIIPPGEYEYRFLVDGEWRDDPQNDRLCPNCFGTQNNFLVVPGK